MDASMGRDDGIFQYFPLGMTESSNIYPPRMMEYMMNYFLSSRMFECALDVWNYFPVLLMGFSIIVIGKFLISTRFRHFSKSEMFVTWEVPIIDMLQTKEGCHTPNFGDGH